MMLLDRRVMEMVLAKLPAQLLVLNRADADDDSPASAVDYSANSIQ